MEKLITIIVQCTDETKDLYSVNLTQWHRDKEGNVVNDVAIRKSAPTREEMWEEVESFKQLTNG